MQEDREKLIGKRAFKQKEPVFDDFKILQTSQKKNQVCDYKNFVKPQKDQMVRVFKRPLR